MDPVTAFEAASPALITRCLVEEVEALQTVDEPAHCSPRLEALSLGGGGAFLASDCRSECDSEIIAVYLAEFMSRGLSLETSMKHSLDDLDGVFTYVCVTGNQLGVAKDEMAAKPLVLFESDPLVAVATEEVAIRSLVKREVVTRDPYEREVLVWQVLAGGAPIGNDD